MKPTLVKKKHQVYTYQLWLCLISNIIGIGKYFEVIFAFDMKQPFAGTLFSARFTVTNYPYPQSISIYNSAIILYTKLVKT